MPNAHPVELRERVVKAYESGEGSYVTIAKKFRVGLSSVKRWVEQMLDVGHLRPRKKRGGTPSDVSVKELEAILDRLPDATAGEITAEYNRGRRGRARRHMSSIKRALHRGGYVVKKKD